MNDIFVAFLKTPDKESFLKVRSSVIYHDDYNPYSRDIKTMSQYFENGQFEDVVSYNNINVLLSPGAHHMKSQAFLELGKDTEAKSELYIWDALLKGIESTGNGTILQPFLVTRITDEKDFLAAYELKFANQALINQEGVQLDCIDLADGKKVYFDITDCYQKMFRPTDGSEAEATHTPEAVKEESFYEEEQMEPEKKKWWKFW